MALIICEECNKEFSEKAETCPNCGCPVSEMKHFTDQMKEMECPIDIKGDEKLGIQYVNKYGIMIILAYAVWVLYELTSNDRSTAGNYIIGFIFIAGVTLIVGLVFNLFPSAFKKRKEAKIIYDYFKTRYPLLKDNKPSYQTLEVITRKSGDMDYLLFGIYMTAYKMNADAIVVNSSNAISHISSGRKRRTETLHEVVATLIKYN